MALAGGGDVSRAVQQAVDDGCINVGPNDTRWDWRKPIVLKEIGTREHSPATPQVLPNLETDVPGQEPPDNYIRTVVDTGWCRKLSVAMFKYEQRHPGAQEVAVTVAMSDGNDIEGTVKIYAVGAKIWTPSVAAGGALAAAFFDLVE